MKKSDWVTLPALTDKENTILTTEYKSLPIGKLSDAEVSKWAKALLIKIHYITGWVLPPSDEGMRIIVDQFEMKLKESYDMVNSDEIEYAFRTYGILIKDWGKNMNLSMIHEVMRPYLDERMDASNAEEKIKNPPPIPPKFDDEAYNDALRGNAEMWYQWILLGKIKYAPEGMKEILVKDNFLTKEADISDFLVDWIGKGNKHLYTKN